ncbi:hypothetical protein [Paenibacillus jiagnxiensis]|uniref:hypothetical protein n=1 Tax=Paenibacillus jiagnxiensis TaxID=3228926 RepID=UPI0033ADAB7A
MSHDDKILMWYTDAAKADRKWGQPLMILKEESTDAITLPEDPEEAKRVLAGIMNNYLDI